jgi:integrase/recombinase XerD
MELKFLRFKSVSETVQQFIYSIASEVNTFAGENNIRTKSFFGYLIFEDYRLDNPLELIESLKPEVTGYTVS